MKLFFRVVGVLSMAVVLVSGPATLGQTTASAPSAGSNAGAAAHADAPRGALPGGISLGRARAGETADLPEGEAGEASEANVLLRRLAAKAFEGDETRAASLTDRVLASGVPRVEPSFRETVEGADALRAAELLGGILLQAGDEGVREEGLELIETAAAAESVAAMEILALILLEGRFGREASVDEAVRLLRRARQLPGAKEAHRLLGELSLAGVGVPQDLPIAIEHFRRGAEAGSEAARLSLHRLLRESGAGSYDLEEAERQARAAADAGSAEAAYELALFFERHAEGAPDWTAAASWLGVAVERGHGGAATRLASYRISGRGATADPADAVRLLRRGAELGDAEACFKIGEFYDEGVHLPEDPVAAAAWIRIAAELGYPVAENALGLRLLSGLGTPSDPAQAVEWFARAAQRGFPPALVNLGEIYESGIGVAADPREAARQYEAAARAGHGGGMARLARLLASASVGDTDMGDPVAAAYWAHLAARSDVEGAADFARTLREGLSEDERKQLDRRTEEAAGR